MKLRKQVIIGIQFGWFALRQDGSSCSALAQNTTMFLLPGPTPQRSLLPLYFSGQNVDIAGA